MILSSGSATAYRLRARVAEDSRGEVVRSWTDPERVRIPRATFRRRSSTELADVDGSRLAADAALYIVGAFDLEPDDRIEADGEVWRVDGEPLVRRGLGSQTFTSAALARAKGVPA